MIKQYYINWSNEAANVIQNPKHSFILSLFISGIVKVESNTFYKYEYEYTICVIYKTQIGCCT